MPEAVKHPAHYTKPSGQVWDVLDEWFPTDPLLWQAGKYLARWNAKGDPVDNLQKAIDYIQRRIDFLKLERDKSACQYGTVKVEVSDPQNVPRNPPLPYPNPSDFENLTIYPGRRY